MSHFLCVHRICFSVRSASVEVINLLLRYGANVNSETGPNKASGKVNVGTDTASTTSPGYDRFKHSQNQNRSLGLPSVRAASPLSLVLLRAAESFVGQVGKEEVSRDSARSTTSTTREWLRVAKCLIKAGR